MSDDKIVSLIRQLQEKAAAESAKPANMGPIGRGYLILSHSVTRMREIGISEEGVARLLRFAANALGKDKSG
jgi:hypothetical protein